MQTGDCIADGQGQFVKSQYDVTSGSWRHACIAGRVTCSALQSKLASVSNCFCIDASCSLDDDTAQLLNSSPRLSLWPAMTSVWPPGDLAVAPTDLVIWPLISACRCHGRFCLLCRRCWRATAFSKPSPLIDATATVYMASFKIFYLSREFVCINTSINSSFMSAIFLCTILFRAWSVIITPILYSNNAWLSNNIENKN